MALWLSKTILLEAGSLFANSSLAAKARESGYKGR